MQEKYYIDIDSNRKIIGRYLLSIHGENIPNAAQEVSEEVFNTSIQENHNYLNENLTSCIKDVRTAEEISYEASFPSQAELNNMEFEAKLLEKLIEWGVSINV